MKHFSKFQHKVGVAHWKFGKKALLSKLNNITYWSMFSKEASSVINFCLVFLLSCFFHYHSQSVIAQPLKSSVNLKERESKKEDSDKTPFHISYNVGKPATERVSAVKDRGCKSYQKAIFNPMPAYTSQTLTRIIIWII